MFAKIPGPSTLGSYNVHNVLAGSNIFDLSVLCQTSGFPRPKTQVIGWERSYYYVKGISQILNLVQCLCALKACNFYFSQVINMSFPCICAKFTFCYY